jgi:uncharacterized membrane protein
VGQKPAAVAAHEDCRGSFGFVQDDRFVPGLGASLGPSITIPETEGEPMAQEVNGVTGHKFFLLFLFLLVYLLLYPFMGETGVRFHVFRMASIAVTLVSVYAVSFRRGLILVAVLLAVPALMAHAVVFRTRIVPAAAFSVVLSFAFDVFIIVVMYRRVFARETATAETLFGAICIYLLTGFSFARLYAVLAIMLPHAFYLDPTIYSHTVPVGFDFIYFSFGSMTTAGASGIAGASPEVRSVSMLESILAVFYLAVMISRLMGAYRPKGPVKSDTVSGV